MKPLKIGCHGFDLPRRETGPLGTENIGNRDILVRIHALEQPAYQRYDIGEPLLLSVMESNVPLSYLEELESGVANDSQKLFGIALDELGTELHRVARRSIDDRMHPSAQPGARLQHDHTSARCNEAARSGEAGYSAANDYHIVAIHLRLTSIRT
jgi:hypothetical protein